MAELDAVLERLERIEAENAELRRLLSESRSADAPYQLDQIESERPVRSWSRRALMRRGAVAAAGVAGAAVLLPVARATAADSLTLGDQANAASAPTALRVTQASSSSMYGLAVTDAGLDRVPESTTLLGHARDTYDDAVLGFHQKGGTGVKGFVTGGPGIGVFGEHDGPTVGWGVVGLSNEGTGVAGNSRSGVGMRGKSHKGRGGTFEGPLAAVQLVPHASAASHPHKGQSGDLFVDAQNRLWFCKGETTWRQLA